MARPLAQKLLTTLRIEMARQQVTGAKLAARLGVSEPWVSRRLLGRTRITVDDLERIANALNVPVEVFLSDSGRAA